MCLSEPTPFRLRTLVGRSPEWAPYNEVRYSHFFSRNNQQHLDPRGLAIFRRRAKLPLPERAEQEALLRVIGRSNYRKLLEFSGGRYYPMHDQVVHFRLEPQVGPEN